MSETLGTYSFVPWMRSGVANKISAADNDPAVVLRASFPLSLKAKGSGGEAGETESVVTRDVALYGPGDIVGIEKTAIVRTEPHDWVTNFEPNYLPYIDFYDEDFPHRYTPAAPSGARLRPWLALIVLTEDEFRDGGNMIGRPLPFITIKASPFESVFPSADEMWAWAHIHVDKALGAADDPPIVTNMEAAQAQLRSTLQQNPDLAHSRLLCPRKLAPNTAYHAFLVPTFETGRLAALGLDPSEAANATASSWGSGRTSAPSDMPIYYRWYFRTGSRGDFEELVKLLKPKPADERVGRREMDVQHPGSNINGISDPQLRGVLKLGGALLAPLSETAEETLRPWEEWDASYPHSFQQSLAGFLNLADEYKLQAADTANAASNSGSVIEADPDPLITPPIYGSWHALQHRLLVDADGAELPDRQNWLHQLNLDPRWRSAAGFGTDVIVANQEEYMDAAWDQIGDVIEANRQIRQAQLAERAASLWFEKHFKTQATFSPAKVFAMTAPVHARAMIDGVTLQHRTTISPVQRSATSAPLRRMLRPRGRLARKLARATRDADSAAGLTSTLLNKINAGEVQPTPSVTAGTGVPTVDVISEKMISDITGGSTLRKLIRSGLVPISVWVLVALLGLLLLAALFGALGFISALFIGAVAAVGWYSLNRAANTVRALSSLAGTGDTPEAVDALPSSPNFVLTPSLPLGNLTNVPPEPRGRGGSDSVEASRFKVALKENAELVTEAREMGRKDTLVPLDLPKATGAVMSAIDPKIVVPRFVFGRVHIPDRIRGDMVESFVEAMAYPVFDIPMYRPLVNKSAETFVPNLRHIPPDSVTLLATNQPFIESYMVGLNHEFGRELLWREYMTDLRGSYFRQFWDVSGYMDRSGDDPESLRERLRDIPPIHRWSLRSKLGEHDQRELDGAVEEEVVLVIRGELLKKYPNAVIYARKAKWQPMSESDPTPNKNAERELDDGSEPKSPLYHAKVDPDIYFFGFDLTVEEARGDPEADNEPGWFFVFEERAGEPRFGLDVSREGPLQVWNDLSWNDVIPGVVDGQHILLSSVTPPTIASIAPTGGQIEKAEQWEEDRQLQWSPDIHSGELAYIFFQSPMRVAIHSSEMLPK